MSHVRSVDCCIITLTLPSRCELDQSFIFRFDRRQGRELQRYFDGVSLSLRLSSERSVLESGEWVVWLYMQPAVHYFMPFESTVALRAGAESKAPLAAGAAGKSPTDEHIAFFQLCNGRLTRAKSWFSRLIGAQGG